MRFIFAFVTGALLAASPAFAADDAGFYVGAGLGQSSVKVDIVEGADFDASSTAFKLFGGYQFFKYLGVELEYIDAGDADDSWSYDSGTFTERLKATIGFSGFNTSAVGILPIGEKFNLFAKLGFIYWDADLKLQYTYTDIKGSFSESERDSDSGTDFSWGIGGTFKITPNLGVRAEYQDFDIAEADRTDLWTISGVWMF